MVGMVPDGRANRSNRLSNGFGCLRLAKANAADIAGAATVRAAAMSRPTTVMTVRAPTPSGKYSSTTWHLTFRERIRWLAHHLKVRDSRFDRS